MADPETPAFMLGTMSWLYSGFFFSGEVPSDLDRLAEQRTADGSYRFAQALHRAQNGDFEGLVSLHSWLDHPLDEAWGEATVSLFGDAGRRSELQLIGNLLDHGPEEILIRASGSARMAGQPWLIPFMLRAWRRSTDRHAHSIIGSDISRIMEPDGQRLIREMADIHPSDMEPTPAEDENEDTGADRPDDADATFETLVNSRLSAMYALYGEQTSLWNGQPFSVLELVRDMKQLIRNLPTTPVHGLFIAMRRKLEGTTGWNCSKCYRGGELDPLGAMAVLEEIEDSLDLSRFKPGERYFFGHPITG